MARPLPTVTDLSSGRQPYVQAGVTFLVALAVYGWTCAPGVGLDDSGELTLVAATLGVAHPPGFPTYTLMGHLFSKLPMGTVAWRLNLMSGVFAAVAAAFLTLVLYQLMAAETLPGRDSKGKQQGKARQHDSLQPWFCRVFPVAGGLTLAFSVTLWSYATRAEVYSLNLALWGAFFWCLLAWRRHFQAESPAASRFLAVAGLLYGLALGVHHATVLLTTPATLWLVLRTAGVSFFLSRRVLVPLASLALGLLTYLYLPLAANSRPIYSWGDPTTWSGFWHHVSAKVYQGYLLAWGGSGIRSNFSRFWSFWFQDLTPPATLLVFLGLARLWRRDRDLWLALVAVGILGGGYSLLYHNEENWDAYLLPTFFVTALAAGWGLRHLWEWTGRRLRRGRPRAGLKRAALAAVILLPALNFMLHYQRSHRRHDHLARAYVEDVLAGVGPGGVILTANWHLTSPFLYLRHVEGLRPDVALFDFNLANLSWYLESYVERRLPELAACCKRERQAYLELLVAAETASPHDRSLLLRRQNEFFNAVLESQLVRAEVHMTDPRKPNVGTAYHWVPHGLTYRIYTYTEPRLEHPPPLDHPVLLEEAFDPRDLAYGKVLRNYAAMLAHRAAYLISRRHYDGVAELLDRSSRIDPTSDLPHLVRADLELTRGQVDSAIRALEEAQRLNPDNPSIQRHLQVLRRDG